MPRETEIGTEVADVTPDSDTTFKVKRSKVNLQGAGHTGVLSPHLFAIYIDSVVKKVSYCKNGCYIKPACVQRRGTPPH